ncbi:uncharacterized protein CYBJADRAFT_49491 [Cyberlindnera jadinii NRRL Y-1542]|uniref:Secreted protein n=1 Tax=Cyberlindnera jadinii (strain ATCC 18201 / CBS 1600 / BCRC 20928 / JCM 3617 / NBRC 0987 / NRRL Y-1542) TaxID=983966 RepID=A0A1E4S7S4_CYBJN|nr:hypothetical protein CYBJADRAFT_49491 [Cyberlindnera jadinii NRRL Y-1542]ODV75546.1 hypothetical protein CYBJADRAFT_49491 [Cyberlindnera jadinii NRRL Y-1542]
MSSFLSRCIFLVPAFFCPDCSSVCCQGDDQEYFYNSLKYHYANQLAGRSKQFHFIHEPVVNSIVMECLSRGSICTEYINTPLMIQRCRIDCNVHNGPTLFNVLCSFIHHG